MMRLTNAKPVWRAMIIAACALGTTIGQQCSLAQTLTSVEPAIEPDAEIQAQIQRTTDARENFQSFYREFVVLLGMAHGRDEEMVKQLAYFTQHISEGELGIRVLEVRRILDMMLEIRDEVIVRALAPHLGSKDRGLRSLVEDWFEYHDTAHVGTTEYIDALKPINFSAYRIYVRGKVVKDEPVPELFTEYIFRRSPTHALWVFVYATDAAQDFRRGRDQEQSAQDVRNVIWSGHLVNDAIWRKENHFNDEFQTIKDEAIGRLNELSAHKDWWVRLYVAVIVEQHPELRTDAVVERLRNDEAALVRAAIARMAG